VGQVNFYTLGSAEPGANLQFVCRLTEKARELGHRVYIHTATAAQAQALDDLLWTLRPSSFIPHGQRTESAATLTEPVTIAALPAPAGFNEVLINLSAAPYSNHAQFSRINEIVAADAQSIHEGRERYRFYREAGATLETFKL
jgi:DNA polymerase-3 subunit chi